MSYYSVFQAVHKKSYSGEMLASTYEITQHGLHTAHKCIVAQLTLDRQTHVRRTRTTERRNARLSKQFYHLRPVTSLMGSSTWRSYCSSIQQVHGGRERVKAGAAEPAELCACLAQALRGSACARRRGACARRRSARRIGLAGSLGRTLLCCSCCLLARLCGCGCGFGCGLGVGMVGWVRAWV